MHPTPFVPANQNYIREIEKEKEKKNIHWLKKKTILHLPGLFSYISLYYSKFLTKEKTKKNSIIVFFKFKFKFHFQVFVFFKCLTCLLYLHAFVLVLFFLLPNKSKN